jgi:catechol 2,3-dioxygenase-like lactoylglutathione lyase family enzyme
MSVSAQLATIVIDCGAPGPLAEFYRALTGWEVTDSDADFVYLGDGGPIQLAFQRVDGYQPASWPGPAKQAHLDFKVPDIERAAKELIERGATRPEFQPGGDEWVVLADPAGHLFCLAAAG